MTQTDGASEPRIQVDLGIQSVSWTDAGTAFGNAIASRINERGIRARWGRLANGWFHCAPEEDDSFGTLVCLPVPEGIRCYIIGNSRLGAANAIPVWMEVISAAADAVRERGQWHWSAWIGPSPRSTGSNFRLARDISLGTTLLKAPETYMREWTHNQVSDMLSRSAWGSWPVVVSGSALGFDSEDARELALNQLGRICALIGLAWNCWWTVRNGPYAFTSPQSMSVPSFAFPQEAQLFGDDDPDPGSRIRLRGLPSWLEYAWLALDAKPHLEVALGSFNEGIRLSMHHPSYAVVAFVAAIENVGAGPAVGPSGKIKERPSARSAFIEGLKATTSPEAAKNLVNRFYGRRSATAHSGVLHGWERRFGWPTNVFFGDDPWSAFVVDATRIQALARIVLATELMKPL